MTERPSETAVIQLTTRIRNTSEQELAAFTSKLVNLLMSGAELPGFWSGELIPPNHTATEWVLIQRFRSQDDAAFWKESPLRKTLLAELETIGDDVSEHGVLGTVATAITTDVKPGMETAYWDWLKKVQAAQARFPHYAGAYLQPPPPDKPRQWTTLLRFNTPEALESWFASTERQQLLSEGEYLVNARHFQKLTSSFPGWFPSDEHGGQPPRWKTSILVMLGLFPVLMLQRRFVFPLLSGLNLTLVIAIATMMSVFLVSWITNRILIRTFSWWLLPSEVSSKTTLTGTAILICVFAIEIAIFWNFLGHH